MKWKREILVSDCAPYPNVQNGQLVEITKTGTLYGATVNYTCDAGYTTNNNQLVCTANGTWSNSSCTKKGKAISKGDTADYWF